MSTVAQPAPAQTTRVSKTQLNAAYGVCTTIARKAARNFYYSFLALPKGKRNAVCAVYAFMRHADDISDDSSLAVAERRTRLAEWLESLRQVQAGQPTDDPVLLALSDTQRRFKIPFELLEKLVEGTAMDLEESAPSGAAPRLRCRTFDDLYRYCYYVASVVGLVCIRIFGYRDSKAEGLAERVGVAFQLTNIIRDVREDAEMGRVYLPQDDLELFGLSASAVTAKADHAFLRPVLEREAGRAREHYQAAEQLLPLIDEDSQPALWVLCTIYQRLLEKIVQKNYDVFSERVRLTTREKLSILAHGFYRRLKP